MIRVLLGELPTVLAEASERLIAASADLTCTGRSSLADALDAVSRSQSDALILTTDDPASPSSTRMLLDAAPQLKIVCVARDGRVAALHERPMTVVRVQELGFESIFAALRRACALERCR